MKKTILCLTVLTLSFLPALQADEVKACDKSNAAACSSTAKATTCSTAAKAASCTEQAACCSKKTVRVLHSPRASLLAKR